MKTFSVILASLSLAAVIGLAPAAQAHSPKQCERQIKTYQTACKFSPTARLAGMCIVTETLKACRDRKSHKARFHNNKG